MKQCYSYLNVAIYNGTNETSNEYFLWSVCLKIITTISAEILAFVWAVFSPPQSRKLVHHLAERYLNVRTKYDSTGLENWTSFGFHMALVLLAGILPPNRSFLYIQLKAFAVKA